MTTDNKTVFGHVAQLIEEKNVASILECLAEHFRQSNQHAELFEVLKATVRHRLGLPIFYIEELDDLNEKKQRQLEDGLLDACHEVGLLMLADGNLSQAWVYLQLLPDRSMVSDAIKSFAVNDENFNEVIDITLYQWAAPEFGFDLLLQRHGTCNAITFFDTQVAFQNQSVRSRLATLLINHIHFELCENIKRCVFEKDGQDNLPSQLAELIENRSWLFDSCGHHLDVTHLASAVRIARHCSNNTEFETALDLCFYGERLDKQLQYPSDIPFEDTYYDHRQYFRALLGIDGEKSIDHFRSKLKEKLESGCDEDVLAIRNVLIEILARTGKNSLAIRESVLSIGAMDNSHDFASILELAKTQNDYNVLMDFYKSNDDLLGFAFSGVSKLLD